VDGWTANPQEYQLQGMSYRSPMILWLPYECMYVTSRSFWVWRCHSTSGSL